MPRARALLVAAALVVAVAAPGHTETVDVTLANPAGSRTVYVESMLGGSLSSLDFGSGRSLPFRVRVVDSQYGAAPFTVDATMTRLYKDGSTSAEHLDSAKVSLGSQTNPLAATGVSALVAPIYDLVATVDSTLCGLLGVTEPVTGAGCQLSASDVVGSAQTVVADLSSLSGLPLVPQTNETGAFTNAEFGAGTAGEGDPDATGAPAPTALAVAHGSLNASGIAGLTSLLDVSPATDAVSADVIIEAFTAAYAAISTLTPALIDSIVAATVATAQAITIDEVLSLTGTYLSLPTLSVDTANAPTGTFTGTLVLTATQ